MSKPQTTRSWFFAFAQLNTLFILLQLALIFSKGGSFVSALPMPSSVYAEIGLTLLLQGLLYFLLTCWQTGLMWGFARLTGHAVIQYRLYACIGLGVPVALLFTNAACFPLSLFSRTLFPELPSTIAYLLMILLWAPLGFLSLNSLWQAWRIRPVATSLSLASVCTTVGWLMHMAPILPLTPTSKPNIILIGVDSLTPERIDPVRTPTLAHFIHHSVWFKETISPLARTYPAWSTILTGLYPAHHLAQYNLMPPNTTRTDLSIAWALQNAGYQTVFATDDRRFNNIDQAFGFQRIVGPKRGINDILMGSFNDFPLSNLFINSPLGPILFPYNYMNRASYFSYYPSTFDHAIQSALFAQSRQKPLFLAVHFTLPHWPYAFASTAARALDDEYSVDHREPLYDASLQAVDTQVANLLQTLEQQGYLDNSLVVLLSDHGETLYASNSRTTTRPLYQGLGTSPFETYLLKHTSTVLNKSAGHGSDLLSPAQYHCVLAFQARLHQALTTHEKTVTTRVALLDIAPTLQAFSGVTVPHGMDGVSLWPTIMDEKITLPSRAFIMESGMLPNQFLSQKKARDLGQAYFMVNAHDGQLHLRPDALKALDAMKLYAILQDDWLLALYPTPEGYLPIIQQQSTGKWIDNLRGPFAKASPAHALLAQLRQFYPHPTLATGLSRIVS